MEHELTTNNMGAVSQLEKTIKLYANLDPEGVKLTTPDGTVPFVGIRQMHELLNQYGKITVYYNR